MTPAEIGKLAEKLFEQAWLEAHGKRVYLHRFTDTSDIRARFQGKTIAHLPPQPADYHVTAEAVMPHYAEVKGTTNKTSFNFSAIQEGQLRAMKRVAAAQGQYWLYVYSLYFNLWYRIPPAYILDGVLKSLNFEKNGKEFEWIMGNQYGRK
jgi:penicillin-binding protein-related factor A (putative recombinase)